MRSFHDLTKQVAQTEALQRSQRLDALGQLTGGVAVATKPEIPWEAE